MTGRLVFGFLTFMGFYKYANYANLQEPFWVFVLLILGLLQTIYINLSYS